MSEAWPTDDDLATVNSELRDAAVKAIQETAGDLLDDSPELIEEMINERIGRIDESNYENFIANDPTAIKDLFDSYSRIQR